MRRMKIKAFTLIEVLGAIVVFSMAIVPMLMYQADNLSTNVLIERMIKATLLAEGEMEKAKTALYQSFETDVSLWSKELGDSYLALRQTDSLSETLKVVEVSVGYDTDGDMRLDADEVLVTLTSQEVKRYS